MVLKYKSRLHGGFLFFIVKLARMKGGEKTDKAEETLYGFSLRDDFSEDIKKIIAIVQNIDGKKIWSLNCVLTGMEVLKSKVEDESKSVLRIEKTSLVDIMKRMPMQMNGEKIAGEPMGKTEDQLLILQLYLLI